MDSPRAKKKSMEELNSTMDLSGLQSLLSYRQVFWLADRPPAEPSRLLTVKMSATVVYTAFVPAYSAGPTLRICTVFPFHHRRFYHPGDTCKIFIHSIPERCFHVKWKNGFLHA